MRVQASASSSSRSTAGAEESSETKSEPKSARGQRRADGTSDGDSRDWVRMPLCAVPLVPWAATDSLAEAACLPQHTDPS